MRSCAYSLSPAHLDLYAAKLQRTKHACAYGLFLYVYGRTLSAADEGVGGTGGIFSASVSGSRSDVGDFRTEWCGVVMGLRE